MDEAQKSLATLGLRVLLLVVSVHVVFWVISYYSKTHEEDVQRQSGNYSFTVALPGRVYSQLGWMYICEVVNKPRVGGKMQCDLLGYKPSQEPTQTPWVVTSTPEPAKATSTATVTPMPYPEPTWVIPTIPPYPEGEIP